jgi:hypothetical protein
VEISDINLGNVLIEKYMEEEKLIFQKHRGKMLRHNMQKEGDP